MVVLDPDVMQVSLDSESVNQAWRALAGIIVRKDPSLAVRDRRHAEQLVGPKTSPLWLSECVFKVVTDDVGNFIFTDLPAATFVLTVEADVLATGIQGLIV